MNYLVRIWSMEYAIVAYAGAMKVTLETTVKHVPPLRPAELEIANDLSSVSVVSQL